MACGYSIIQRFNANLPRDHIAPGHREQSTFPQHQMEAPRKDHQPAIASTETFAGWSRADAEYVDCTASALHLHSLIL